ncbi:MAG TPA: HAD family phosphatase [Ginsengibacter sp.]|nr:HAD family phosphatase [Ginsengibacter sp.]
MLNKETRFPIKPFLEKHHIRTVIFDLDGTLLDNNPYHLTSWLEYLKEKNIHITREEYDTHMNGRTNKDAIEYVFNRKMDESELRKIIEEKEAVYRKIYASHIRPIDGLLSFLELLAHLKIKMGIATSGIQPNIDFMFDHIPIKKYFSAVVNSSHIKKGKPDPEIFITTARQLYTAPAECLVFEDSLPGVEAALRAGMHVIAITTSHEPEAFHSVDMAIANYNQIL